MTFKASCAQCQRESPHLPIVTQRVLVSATELTRWECQAKKHEQWLWIQNPFYELLFLRGVYDLGDRDFRNAVLNFFAAYDTFIATTMRLIWSSLGVTAGFPKRLRRNEDAFQALYPVKTGTFPEMVAKDIREIRNAVAHDDMVPTPNEVVVVGEAIRGFINRVVEALDPLHEENRSGAGARARMTAALARNPPPAPTTPGSYFSPSTSYIGINLEDDVGRQASEYNEYGSLRWL